MCFVDIYYNNDRVYVNVNILSKEDETSYNYINYITRYNCSEESIN